MNRKPPYTNKFKNILLNYTWCGRNRSDIHYIFSRWAMYLVLTKRLWIKATWHFQDKAVKTIHFSPFSSDSGENREVQDERRLDSWVTHCWIATLNGQNQECLLWIHKEWEKKKKRQRIIATEVLELFVIATSTIYPVILTIPLPSVWIPKYYNWRLLYYSSFLSLVK